LRGKEARRRQKKWHSNLECRYAHFAQVLLLLSFYPGIFSRRINLNEDLPMSILIKSLAATGCAWRPQARWPIRRGAGPFSLSVGAIMSSRLSYRRQHQIRPRRDGDLTRDHKTLGRVRATCCWAITRAWRSITTVYTNNFDASIAPHRHRQGQVVTAMLRHARLKVELAQLPTNGGSDPAIRYSASAPAPPTTRPTSTPWRALAGRTSRGTASDSRSDNAIAPLLVVGVRTALSDNVACTRGFRRQEKRRQHQWPYL